MNSFIEQQIENYRAPQEVVDELRPIRTVMLTGITAAGKDTIITDILNESDDFARVVTSTTRAPRENNGVLEQHGREYYFLSEEEAVQNMQSGEYIEVAPAHGRINGSLVSEYRRIAGLAKTALTDINYEGADRFLSFGMQELSVYFVMPPNFEVWIARLMKRQGGTIGDHEEILRRFQSAQVELNNALTRADFIPITNDVSHETARKIIEYSTNGTGPTDEERAKSADDIRALNQAITDYISQIEGIR